MAILVSLLFLLIPIAATIGSLLIFAAVFAQIGNRKKVPKDKMSVKKLYIWGTGLWAFALLSLIPLYYVFYLAAGAAV